MDKDTPPQDNENSNKTPDFDGGGNIYASESEPSLGRNPNTMLVLAGVGALGAAYFVYSIFSPPEAPKKENPSSPTSTGTVAAGTDIPKIESAISSSVNLPPPPITSITPPPPPISIPSFTPPPVAPSKPLVVNNIPTVGSGLSSDPLPPPPPPPPPPIASVDTPGSATVCGTKVVEKDQRRIRANMLLLDGGATGNGQNLEANKSGFSGSDPNSAFFNKVSASTAEKAAATSLSNLGMTIAQGKIIDATLETAIVSDLPSPLRAIVSRDVYSESGRNVLIPKGSRLIGTYNTSISTGQNRLMIVWTRLIRPDGIDIQIGSPTVDRLGRGGLEGFLDNKFSEIFSAAILTSALTIAGAVAVDNILPNEQQQSTTTTPEGNQTTNSSASQAASREALTNLSDTGKDVVGKLININPTVYVDQGTPFNVFVNKDLTFPAEMGGNLFVR